MTKEKVFDVNLSEEVKEQLYAVVSELQKICELDPKVCPYYISRKHGQLPNLEYCLSYLQSKKIFTFGPAENYLLPSHNLYKTGEEYFALYIHDNERNNLKELKNALAPSVSKDHIVYEIRIDGVDKKNNVVVKINKVKMAVLRQNMEPLYILKYLMKNDDFKILEKFEVEEFVTNKIGRKCLIKKLSKKIDRIGFVGNLRKVFVQVSDRDGFVRFRSKITETVLKEAGLKCLTIDGKKSGKKIPKL